MYSEKNDAALTSTIIESRTFFSRYHTDTENCIFHLKHEMCTMKIFYFLHIHQTFTEWIKNDTLFCDLWIFLLFHIHIWLWQLFSFSNATTFSFEQLHSGKRMINIKMWSGEENFMRIVLLFNCCKWRKKLKILWLEKLKCKNY